MYAHVRGLKKYRCDIRSCLLIGSSVDLETILGIRIRNRFLKVCFWMNPDHEPGICLVVMSEEMMERQQDVADLTRPFVIFSDQLSERFRQNEMQDAAGLERGVEYATHLAAIREKYFR